MTDGTRRIVVTGGSGFIGSRLVARLLEHGHHVTIVDKVLGTAYPDRTRVVDVRDADALADSIAGHDAIIHLAAEHRDDVRPASLYDEVNVEGMDNVCRAAATHGVRDIVFTSSVAVYGIGVTDCDEQTPPAPANDYGRTKLEAERRLERWVAEDDARGAWIVRPTVVFGEGNRGNLYNLLRQIAHGPFLMIGSGRNRKSIAYVENVAAFLALGLEAPRGVRVFNYVDQPVFDMNTLVRRCREALGMPGEVGRRVPYVLAYAGASLLDGVGYLTGRRFAISRVRVKKFCASSVYGSAIETGTEFVPPVPMERALMDTIRHEFGGSA